MVNVEALAGKIFSLLKGNGLQLKIYDQDGTEVTDPNMGRRFFVTEPNIMITIDEDSNSVEFSKGRSVGPEAEALQTRVRKLADEFLMNSRIKVFGKQIQPRDYAYQAKMKKAESMMETGLPGGLSSSDYMIGGRSAYKNTNCTTCHGRKVVYKTKDGNMHADNKVGSQRMSCPSCNGTGDNSLKESFSKMFGSLKTSQQTLENVKILVRHKTAIDENVKGSRSRQIQAIFLECNGERFRFPHNYLPGARAMAQHMAHGGVFGDKVGQYISESTGQLLQLQSFNRYVTTNKLINEDSSGIIDTVKESIETLRTELKKLTGVKTYESVKARIETFERETLSEDDVSGLKDLFTIRKFDEKFEGVLPIVKQLIQEKDTYHKRIEEAAGNIIKLRHEAINTTPMFEFASENARLGFKLNELALRILENEELAGFVNKIGTKLCKEGQVNDFEKAILSQVLENVTLEEKVTDKKEIKESQDLSTYFDKYILNFY